MCKLLLKESPKDRELFDAVAFERDIRVARDETAPSQEEELWTAGFRIVSMVLAVR